MGAHSSKKFLIHAPGLSSEAWYRAIQGFLLRQSIFLPWCQLSLHGGMAHMCSLKCHVHSGLPLLPVQGPMQQTLCEVNHHLDGNGVILFYSIIIYYIPVLLLSDLLWVSSQYWLTLPHGEHIWRIPARFGAIAASTRGILWFLWRRVSGFGHNGLNPILALYIPGHYIDQGL